MTVVVVESPAKAKTINKYLGADYRVLASYGHIRDLPSKDGSVRPDDDFSMSWEVDGKAVAGWPLKPILDTIRQKRRPLFFEREEHAFFMHDGALGAKMGRK